MSDKNTLYILWTNDNQITAEKMVFLYGINSKLRGWWENVTIIIWGAPAKLVAENSDFQDLVKGSLDKGIHVTACKTCAEQLGVVDILTGLGIEVIYWGEPLTKILKNGETLISV